MSKKCTQNRLALAASQKNFMSKTKRRVRLGKNTSSCPKIRVGSNLATLHFPSGTESKESQRQMLVKGHAVVTCKFFFSDFTVEALVQLARREDAVNSNSNDYYEDITKRTYERIKSGRGYIFSCPISMLNSA